MGHRYNHYFSLFSQLLLLVAIPLMLLMSSLGTINEREKAWYGSGYDPEYAYLFNSLNIARFRLVGHIDHPGTPMQVYGGLVLEGSWLLDNQEGTLTGAVLRNPEKYVQLLNRSVAWLSALAFLLLPALVFLRTRRLWPALLLQLAPFISGFVLYNGFTRVTQEAMLMIASLAMASAITTWLYANDEKRKSHYPLIFGVVTGFGMASKILFGPLALIPVILLGSRRLNLKYLLVSAGSFVIFTLPVVRLYPNIAYWILKLFIFSGQYGSGPVGVVDTGAYLPNLVWLLKVDPILTAIAAISIVFTSVYVYQRKRNSGQTGISNDRVFPALAIAFVLGYVVVAKQPKESYLLAYEIVSPVILIAVLEKMLLKWRLQKIRLVLPAIVAVGLAFPLISHGLAAKRAVYSPDKNGQWETFYRATRAFSAGYATIVSFPGASPAAALYFGNAYSHWRYSSQLTRLYPDIYFFDQADGNVYNWFHQKVDVRVLSLKYRGKIVAAIPVETMPQFKTVLQSAGTNDALTIPYSDDKQTLLAPVVKPFTGNEYTVTLLFSSAEMAGRDAQPYIGNGFRSEGNVKEIGYAGQYSLEAIAASPFAFTTEPVLLSKGDCVDVSVMAYGNIAGAQLLVSEPDSLQILASADAEMRNSSQWDEIKLHFTQHHDSGQVFVYAMNTGTQPVWFDNFAVRITRYRQTAR